MQKSIKITIWIIFIIAIFLLAMMDFEGITGRKMNNDFALRHILAFSVYVILSKITWSTWHILKIIFAAISLGIVIEISQELFTAGVRNFHWQDLINDGIGIIIGLIIIILFQLIKRGFGVAQSPPLGD